MSEKIIALNKRPYVRTCFKFNVEKHWNKVGVGLEVESYDGVSPHAVSFEWITVGAPIGISDENPKGVNRVALGMMNVREFARFISPIK